MSSGAAFPLPAELLLRALEELQFGLAIATGEGGITWGNEAFERLVGSSAGELSELPDWVSLVWPPERDRLSALNRQRVVGQEVPEVYETFFSRTDGSPVPAEVSITTLHDGPRTWVLALARDITARRAAEEQIRRLAAVVNLTSDAVVTVSTDGLITSWNAGAEQMFGYRADEAVGRPVDILDAPGEPNDLPVLTERLRQGEVVSAYQTIRRRRDGSPVHVSISASRLVDEAGQTVGAFGIYRDVSERVHADQDRRRRDEAERGRGDADAANRAKSEFLSHMSHELRKPLNAVLGFAQLLELEVDDPGQRSSVDHILRAGRHLLGLIDEMLDLARTDAGLMSLSMEAVALGDVVGEATALVVPLAAARRVTVLGGAGDLAGQYVRADRQRLRQVLVNLLSNAVRYNREGGSVTVACQERHDERVRISIRDTGHGIAPGHLARIFTPFDRLGAEASGVEGMGLGLALSRGLVDLMGGRIGVDSAVGEGSTFWVDLARAAAPARDDAPDLEPGRREGTPWPA